jgi:hypothetical protein
VPFRCLSACPHSSRVSYGDFLDDGCTTYNCGTLVCGSWAYGFCWFFGTDVLEPDGMICGTGKQCLNGACVDSGATNTPTCGNGIVEPSDNGETCDCGSGDCFGSTSDPDCNGRTCQAVTTTTTTTTQPLPLLQVGPPVRLSVAGYRLSVYSAVHHSGSS